RAAAGEGSTRLLSAGVSLASAIMFVRVGVIVAVINACLLGRVLPALMAATLTAFGFAALYGRSPGSQSPQPVTFKNPFEFWSVLGFAVFLGAMIVVSRLIGEHFGATGAIIGAAVAGLADVDAISVSMARLAPQTLAPRIAALAILVAVATDTISKIAIGAAIGRGRFALEIAIMALGSIVVGACALFMTNALLPE
ncbi:MAG TPA: DUF4010 domain-containing protein, partial [Burkholderiaceae bacterium]|nr:DUF4010 domain-containing protein [Burkholderiaceae bacterium]